MIKQSKNEYLPDFVTHPGVTLKDVLIESGLSQADLAVRTGRPKKTISEIINGKASITAETALQLELVLGIPAEFWNAREQQYRNYLAREEQVQELEHNVEWLKAFPTRRMEKLGWIAPKKNISEKVRELLQFFGVASPEQWSLLTEQQQVAFRKSSKFKSDNAAMSAWLREGVRESAEIECEPFKRDQFIQALHSARGLTTEPPDVFCSRLTENCAKAGVAVVFIPELPRSRASGATRWLTADKAMIQLSLRYKTDDHLWFTFFHEAGHLLLHGKKLIFLEGNSSHGDQEEEANAFSANFLIPPERYSEFKTSKRLSRNSISRFAKSIGIAPGIVVGRLQHDGLLPFSQCNRLKRKFVWSDDA